MYTSKKKGGFKHIYELILDNVDNVVGDNEPDLANEPELVNEPLNEPDLANEPELANEPDLANERCRRGVDVVHIVQNKLLLQISPRARTVR